MVCKFCKEVLPEGASVCPACGMEVEVQEAKKKSVWKTVAIVAACVVIAAIVIGAVMYAVGFDFGTKENDVMYKDSYTVSDSKAAKEADKVVATAGGRELTNAELQIYYWYGVENFFSYYSGYLSYIDIDQSLPLEDQIYDAETGMTWQQYFLERALERWHRYAALNLLAEDADHETSENTLAIIESSETQLEQLAVMYGYESAEAMIQADWSAVCNVDGYMRYMRANLMGMDYYDVKYSELQPTDEEVEAYFTEKAEDFEAIGVTKDSGKYVDARHILIMPQGGTTGDDGIVTYSEEEWLICQKEAEDILDAWLEGDATEESFAALAAEYSEDGGSSSNGGLYEDIYEGQMVEPFEEWCFDDSRQYGDYGLVKTTFGYHIMYFVGSQEVWYVNAQNELITDRTEEMILDGTERWPIKVDYRHIALGDLYGTSAETAETTAPTETTAG